MVEEPPAFFGAPVFTILRNMDRIVPSVCITRDSRWARRVQEHRPAEFEVNSKKRDTALLRVPGAVR